MHAEVPGPLRPSGSTKRHQGQGGGADRAFPNLRSRRFRLGAGLAAGQATSQVDHWPTFARRASGAHRPAGMVDRRLSRPGRGFSRNAEPAVAGGPRSSATDLSRSPRPVTPSALALVDGDPAPPHQWLERRRSDRCCAVALAIASSGTAIHRQQTLDRWIPCGCVHRPDQPRGSGSLRFRGKPGGAAPDGGVYPLS